MADLIDRDKLLEYIDDNFYPTTVSCYMTVAEARAARERHNMFIDAINNAPAVDAVEVVRCKDCASYNNHFSQKGFGWCEEEAMRLVSDNFYCGCGEKKYGE